MNPNVWPEIIEQAAKSPLGILALMVLVIAFLAVTFFRRSSERVRVAMFVLILLGVGLFGYAIIRSREDLIERQKVSALALAAESDALLRAVLDRSPEEERLYWWALLQRGDRVSRLERSVLLAVESVKRGGGEDAQNVLRQGLVLLTRPLQRFTLDGAGVAVTFSRDGAHVIAGDSEGAWRAWAVESGAPVLRVEHEGNRVRRLALSPDARYVASGGESEKSPDSSSVCVWSFPSGNEVGRVDCNGRVADLVFDSSGGRLAVACARAVLLLESTSARVQGRLDHAHQVTAVQFSADGTLLGSACEDGFARIWKLGSGTEVARAQHDRPPEAIAFDPRQRAFATADDEGAHLWSLPNAEPVASMQLSNGVRSLRFRSDGEWLAGDGHRFTVVWDLGGREHARFLHDDWGSGVTFTADGSMLAASARVWDMRTGHELARFADASRIDDMAITADGRLAATASRDGSIAIWRIAYSDLVSEACARVTRNLTPDEWNRSFGTEPYGKTCPEII